VDAKLGLGPAPRKMCKVLTRQTGHPFNFSGWSITPSGGLALGSVHFRKKGGSQRRLNFVWETSHACTHCLCDLGETLAPHALTRTTSNQKLPTVPRAEFRDDYQRDGEVQKKYWKSIDRALTATVVEAAPGDDCGCTTNHENCTSYTSQSCVLYIMSRSTSFSSSATSETSNGPHQTLCLTTLCSCNNFVS